MGKDPIDFRLELLKRAKENPVGKTMSMMQRGMQAC
jgi:hypothetical protein